MERLIKRCVRSTPCSLALMYDTMMHHISSIHCSCRGRRKAFLPREREREMSVSMDRILLLLCVTVVVVADRVSGREQLSSKECESLGFTGLALCSDCNAFAEYVKNQELVSDCLKCCTEDSDDSMSKITYSGAVLEVCMRKLVFYPEIVGFIEEEKDQFPYVKVQYVFNSPPKLIMLDDDGEHKENIRIDNWKREHILQFLREKVKPTSAI